MALWSCPAAWAAQESQQTPEPRELYPPQNLLSNCSFEAVAEEGLASFRPTEGAQAFSVRREGGWHGQAALHVAWPSEADKTASLEQLVPGAARCVFRLSAWLRAYRQKETIVLRLEMLDLCQKVLAAREAKPAANRKADTVEWQKVETQLEAPAGTELVRVAIQAKPGAEADVDALQLECIRKPRRVSWGPHVVDLRARCVEATWALLSWQELPGARYELAYRPLQRRHEEKIVLTGLTQPMKTLVGLQPETTYEISVRVLWPEFYDAAGRVAKNPIEPAPCPSLQIITKPREPREVGLLRIWPFERLEPTDEIGHRPCLEAAGESLFLTHEREEGIALSKIAPDTRRLIWTKIILEKPNEGPAPQLLDTLLLGETLYVLYRSGGELGVIRFSIGPEKLEEKPTLLQSVGHAKEVAEAVLAALRNEPWVIWTERGEQEAAKAKQLYVGRLAGSKIENVTAWSSLFGRALEQIGATSWGDEIVIVGSEVGAETDGATFWALHFDGESFSRWRKLLGLGVCREPRGLQWGSYLYFVFTSDARYLGLGGRYREVMLALWPGQTPQFEIVSLWDDHTGNVTPDITALGRSLWTVHEKFEEAGESDSNRSSLGVFLGRIDFGPTRPIAPP